MTSGNRTGSMASWLGHLTVIAACWLAAPAIAWADPPQTDAAKAKMQRAQQLWTESQKLRGAGKLAEAIAAVEQVLAIVHEGEPQPTEAQANLLGTLGALEQQRENYAQSQRRLEEALDVCQKVYGADHWKTADARISLSDTKLFARLSPQERQEIGAAFQARSAAMQFEKEGKKTEAIAAAEHCRAVMQKKFGDAHPAYARSLNDLAILYEGRGDYARAVPLLREAAEARKKSEGATHPSYGMVLRKLGMVYHSMGDYAQAELLYRQAAEIVKKSLGEMDPSYANCINELARLYVAKGDYALAEPLYRQALEIEKQTIGEANQDYATSLDNLGLVYTMTGDYARAEPLHRQAMEIRKKVLGEAHPEYATSLNNLGLLYQHKGDYAQAESLYRQALEVQKKGLGELHPAYADGLNALAGVCRDMGDYARAESLLLRALAIKKKTLGEAHPDFARSLSDLAAVYQLMGDYARAEPFHRQAMEIRKISLGEMHTDYALSLNNLAVLYEQVGDYSRAEPLYLQAVEITRKRLGESHRDYATSLSNLAAVYSSQNDNARAEPIFLRSLEIRKKALGELHPDYVDNLQKLAICYHELGDQARAEELAQQALKIGKKALGEMHPDYARILYNLAVFYDLRGNYAEAEPLDRQALEIRKKVLGESHPDYALSLSSVALLCHYQGKTAEAEPLAAQSFDFQLRQLERTSAIQTEQQQFQMTGSVANYLNAWLTVTAEDRTAARAAWQRVLVWKGLTTTRQMALRQALKDDSGYAEFRRVSQQLSTLVLNPPLPPSDPEALAAWNERTPELRKQWRASKQKLEAESERLEQDLSHRSAIYYQQHKRQSVTPTEMLASLAGAPQPTALVDLLIYGHGGIKAKKEEDEWRLAAFVAHPDREIERVEFGPARPIYAEVVAWRKSLGRPVQGRDPGAELRRILWEPLQAHLEGVETVLISPDGFLARLPWGALPGEKPGSYLIEDRAIAVLPIPQMLPELLQREQHSGPPASLLLAGDIEYGGDPGVPAYFLATRSAVDRNGVRGQLQFPQLDNAASELTSVKYWYEQAGTNGKIKVLRQSQGTEAAFRDEAPEHAWLHVITHGFFAPGAISARLNSIAPLEPVREGPPPIGRTGIVVETKDGHCLVTGVPAGGPAANDGRLQLGDELVAVAPGETEAWAPVAGKDVPTIVGMLRGPAGTSVRLKVRPRARPDPATVIDLTRVAAPESSKVKAASINPGLMSGLAFAGANLPPMPGKDDGILTGLEVSALDLSKVDSVVLSACETGLGEWIGSEGLLGLQRAFQVAGAKTVVASLWPVPDQETKALMERFYQNLWQKKQPLAKLAALREAQLWMLRQGASKEGKSRGLEIVDDQPADAQKRLPPFYWAAFVLSGDWR